MPAYWEMELPQPTLVARIDLLFRGPTGSVSAPPHRVEADWEGRFVPLVDAPGASAPGVSPTLAAPFATTRLRVSLTHPDYVGLAEVSLLGLDLVPAASPALVQTLADGSYIYEIAAVDRYGARSAASSVPVDVGDVSAPPVP